MAVPKKKTSKSKRDMRRSHHAVKNINVVMDSVTGEYKLPHHISKDGTYNGMSIVKLKIKKDKDSEQES